MIETAMTFIALALLAFIVIDIVIGFARTLAGLFDE